MAVEMRGVRLGEGRTKVIVPVTGATVPELVAQVRALAAEELDIIEWRVDYLDVALDPAQVVAAAGQVREQAGDRPVLLTFRTHHEGGQQPVTSQQYVDLNLAVVGSGLVDAVDVEHRFDRQAGDQVIAAARAAGVPVVGSVHDFTATPPADELVAYLTGMQERGCAVAKAAVMPQTPGDVLTLMSATWTMTSEHPATPVLTMAMGGLGLLTRLSAQLTGSCATFAMVGRASAPGQIPVGELRPVLDLIARNLPQ